ncbi:MAG: PEGA domain-containing protein [Bacteroidales bacterium]|nr:PEGA domain-containing protein [Bacteroidales bacterium]
MMNKIFSLLKQQNGLTLEEIADILKIHPDGVLFFFQQLPQYFESVGGKWYIKHLIDKLPNFTRFDFQYSELVSEEDVIPSSYMNPLVDFVAHRDQGYRGTCVGQAAAYFMDINYMQLTGDKPTSQEMSSFRRAYPVDTLYATSFSAESAYKWSRDELLSNLTSGSYVSASVVSLTKKGICSEYTWPTTKDENNVFAETVTAIEEGQYHKTSGYAEIMNFDHAKNAIYKHGVIMGALRVYENYGSGFDVGEFPQPVGKLIGGHALCFIGYDSNYLYCLHSWGNTTPKIGRVSKEYFNAEAYHVYTVIDEEEVKLLKNRFATISITANVSATIYVDNQLVGKTNLKISLPLGTHHEIKAIYGNEQKTATILIDSDKTVAFSFNIEPPKKTSWLIELVKHLLARYFKK